MIPVTAAQAALIVVAATGALFDLRWRRVPNWLCLLATVLGLGFAVLGHGAGALGNLAHAAIALIAGMALFALKWIGGGDAKFYAGLAAWMPLALAAEFALGTALAGLGLALVMLAVNRRRGADRQPLRAIQLPYAVAIAIGAICAA